MQSFVVLNDLWSNKGTGSGDHALTGKPSNLPGPLTRVTLFDNLSLNGLSAHELGRFTQLDLQPVFTVLGVLRISTVVCTP